MALDKLDETHVKLGVLAMDSGYMAPGQVSEVHEKQEFVDKRFGELAVEAGYLTEEQLEELLARQKDQNLQLGQVILDNNWMTMTDYNEALQEYKDKYRLDDKQLDEFKENNPSSIVRSYFESDTEEFKIEYINLLLKNIYRFIGLRVRVEPIDQVDDYYSTILIEQGMTGDHPLYTYISGDEESLLKLASLYAGEEIQEFNQLAVSAINEFLNMHNGVFITNMSNRGIDLTLHPLSSYRHTEIHGLDGVNCFTIAFGDHSFDIFIAEGPLGAGGGYV